MLLILLIILWRPDLIKDYFYKQGENLIRNRSKTDGKVIKRPVQIFLFIVLIRFVVLKFRSVIFPDFCFYDQFDEFFQRAIYLKNEIM